MITENKIKQEELFNMRGQQANQMVLQDFLGGRAAGQTGVPDFSDQAQRAELMSILSGMDPKTMMQHAPAIAMGTAGFVQPDMLPQDQMSGALQATGVVPNFQNTPEGQARSLAASRDEALAVQSARNQGSMDELAFKAANPSVASAGSPATVSPGTSDKLYEMVLAELARQHPDANLENLDPAAVGALRSRAAEAYQVRKNAEAAVADALAGVPLEPYTHDTWRPFDEETRLRMVPGQAPAPAAPAAGMVPSDPTPAPQSDVQMVPPAGPVVPVPGPGAIATGGGRPGQTQLPPGSIPVPQGLSASEGQTVTHTSGKKFVVKAGHLVPLE
jgi:hypothetical protein